MVDERVFISYGKADQDYAGRLAEYLAHAGIGTWYDVDLASQRVDPHVQEQIDGCRAFMVVMTPESLSSERVNNELYRARSRAKPVLPILRGGDVFSTLREAEVFDATDGRLPDDVFLGRVRAALAPKSTLVSAGTPSDPAASHPPQEPAEQQPTYQQPAPTAAAYPPPPGADPQAPSQHPGQAYPAPGAPMPPPGVPPHYPPPGQYPVPAPAPKRRLGLIIGILAAVAVVLVAIAGVVVYTQLVADTPRGAVNAWFDALKERDIDGVRALTCAEFASEVAEVDFSEAITTVSWDVTAVNEVNSDSATATIDISYTERGQTERETVTFSVVKENGDWKVCGPAEQSVP